MGLLFFDTETTGLFDYTRPADAPGQPRLAEIHALFTDEDGTTLEELNTLIRPDGWTLSPALTAINGLTTEMCQDRGAPVADALIWMGARMVKARQILAFGVNFDLKVLRGEFRRAGMPDLYPLGEARKCCIQQMARKVTALPKNKTPKLSEAVEIILGETLIGAHGAKEDNTASMRLYFKLLGRGIALPAATVPLVDAVADAPADESGVDFL